jgi:hypothetical protein
VIGDVAAEEKLHVPSPSLHARKSAVHDRLAGNRKLEGWRATVSSTHTREHHSPRRDLNEGFEQLGRPIAYYVQGDPNIHLTRINWYPVASGCSSFGVK